MKIAYFTCEGNPKWARKWEKNGIFVSLAQFLEQLDRDDVLNAAFRALTPGRQRNWIIHIDGAKQSATCTARVERGRDKIRAGQGQSEY